nr:glycosyltransferase family 2 protein [uncultured Desulfobulbus sp.]
MKTAIILVNYRTPKLVCDCLLSLRKEIASIQGAVIIVDNNSGDDSTQYINNFIEKHAWQHWVTLLPQQHNLGFAGANNLALHHVFAQNSSVDFFWLLNPDTVVREGAGLHLTNFLTANPTVGIAGSRLEDDDGTPQISAFRHHSIISEFLSGMRLGYLDKLFSNWVVAHPPVAEIPQPTDWLAGASMMVRREVFTETGFLDDGYFLYFEEEDFCKKAEDAGWSSWYVPDSRVVHLVGMASGFSDHRRKAPRRPGYWFESRRRFFLKNYGKYTLAFADLAWMLGYSFWRVRRCLQGKPNTAPPCFLRDFFSHSIFCKGFHL